MRRLRSSAAFLVALVAVGALSRAGELRPAGTVKIGMLKSMFRDVPANMFGVMSKPFHALVESQTGLKGELCLIDGADTLRKEMADDKVQLGVFHGFEYAWMRLRQPDLRPLMLAVGQPGCLRAVLVVPADESGVQSVADLRGKTLALPRGTRATAASAGVTTLPKNCSGVWPSWAACRSRNKRAFSRVPRGRASVLPRRSANAWTSASPAGTTSSARRQPG